MDQRPKSFLQQLHNETKTFAKIDGTTDRGRDYEDLTIARFALSLVCDESVEDFSITSNPQKTESFNNVILTVTTKQNTKKYAIQTRHVEKSNTKLKLKTLENKFKIFEKYKKLEGVKDHNLVVATNINLDTTEEHSKIPIKIGNVACEVTIKAVPPEKLFTDVHKDSLCYKFESVSDGNFQDLELQNYIENLRLYTGLQDVDQLETSLQSVVQDKFGSGRQTVTTYLEYIKKWNALARKKALTKALVKYELVTDLLTPYMKPLTFTQSQTEESLNTKVLRSAMQQAGVTLVDAEKLDILKTMWTHTITDSDEIEIKNLINEMQIDPQAQSRELCPEKFNILLWFDDKSPLILQDNPVVRKVVNLWRGKTCILLRGSGTVKESQDVNPFETLQDLPRPLRKHFEKYFELSIQRKTNKLESLLSANEEMAKLFTIDVLLDVCNGLNVGGEEETLPPSHVSRSLSRAVLGFEVFKTNIADTLFVIEGVEDNVSFKESHKSLQEPHVEESFLISKTEQVVEIQKSNSTHEELKHLCFKHRKKYYHLFRNFNKEGVEFISSNGNVNDLQRFQLKTYYIKEGEIVEPTDRKLHIICAEPGMGKTTLMKSLKNCSTHPWTLLLLARNYASHFEENAQDLKKFTACILKETEKKFGVLAAQILEILMKTGNVLYIWDGLDEASDHNLKIIMSLIEQLYQNGSSQLITSRNNLRDILEERFHVVSQHIKEFDKEEQKKYIKDRLDGKKNYSKQILDGIIKHLADFRSNTILGIPLYIYILTELFIQAPEKYKDIFNLRSFALSDLYEYFVEEKFNVYKKEKNDSKASNDVMNKIIDRFKNYNMRNYKKAAMQIYFDKQQIQNLEIGCEDWLEDCRQHGDLVGLTFSTDQGQKLEFFHNSFGEYFAARYLAENQDKISHFKEFIFEEKFRNIRFFLDSILTKGCPAHRSVLGKNFFELSRKDLRTKDRGGRTPLHLACSWETEYPLLPTKFIDGKYIVDDRKLEISRKDNTFEDLEIVKLLLEENDPTEEDTIFSLHPFAYAYKSRCLNAFAVMTSRQNVKTQEFKKNLCTILYYCVRFDYDEVFNVIDYVPPIEVKYFGSLLFCAVWWQSVKCLRKILSRPEQRTVLRRSQEPLLHEACKKRNVEIVKLLVDMGVNLDVQDEFGRKALFYAKESGGNVLVEILTTGLR